VQSPEPNNLAAAAFEPRTVRIKGPRQLLTSPDFKQDAVAIADIWAGRDPDVTVASASGLAEAVGRSRPGMIVQAPGSVEATAAWLAGEVRPGDAVLVMGGGLSYRIASGLLTRLEEGR